jgi:hypothetical protein
MFRIRNIPKDANAKKRNKRVYQGITLSHKKAKETENKQKNIGEKQENFSFRIKIGEREVEIKGSYEEVMKAIENLHSLVANVQKAFEAAKPKTVATITVKTEAPKTAQEVPAQSFPRIVNPANCEEAVLKILETDWGKWRPRTMEELKEAMRANDIKYTVHVLMETLNELADKGLVRRWNTNTGFVYILAEEKLMPSGGEMQ